MIERSSVKPLQFSAAARMRQFQAQSGPDGASVLLGRTRRVSLIEQGPPAAISSQFSTVQFTRFIQPWELMHV